jgi:magnesium-transporting ATPase (P-type)
LTAFYALFIFSGVFNSFNARTERLSPLANLRKNPLFLLIMLAVSIVQLIMIYFGGRVFRTAGLTAAQLQMIVFMAFSVIPADLFRKILWRIKKRKVLL